jgi:hypothetical protein
MGTDASDEMEGRAMFLKTIAEADASGRVAEIYAEDVRDMGVLMSATTCWTVRPDLLPLWTDFLEGVKAGFTLSPRDWRLITFIAAIEVPSTYCVMVYAQRLIADLGTKEAVLALRRDFRRAGLPERDVAMLAFAQKVARAAHEVTQADTDALRAWLHRSADRRRRALRLAPLLHEPLLRGDRRRA